MLYPFLPRCLLAIPVVLTVLGSPVGVLARPADVFIPYLDNIQSNLPPGLVMRLPTAIPLSGHSDIEESKLIVRVFPSEIPESFTVGLFICERGSHPCLLGSFSVDRNTSASAKRELERHQVKGDRVFLATGVEGYLIEGPRQNPFSAFSTMMWQQNDMIYTISFPAIERENIVLMGVSMASEQPLYHDVPLPVPSDESNDEEGIG